MQLEIKNQRREKLWKKRWIIFGKNGKEKELRKRLVGENIKNRGAQIIKVHRNDKHNENKLKNSDSNYA